MKLPAKYTFEFEPPVNNAKPELSPLVTIVILKAIFDVSFTQ